MKDYRFICLTCITAYETINLYSSYASASLLIQVTHNSLNFHLHQFFDPSASDLVDVFSESLLSFYVGINAVITSRSMLSPFVPEEQVESNSSGSIPSIYPISPTIDFFKTHNYNLKNSIGKFLCSGFMYRYMY